MLIEARKNCENRHINNASFVKSDDTLSMLSGKFSFIHSSIVFQHIPVSRGETIFRNLLTHLEDGGVCVVHFTYGKDSKIRKLKEIIRKYVPFAEAVKKLLNGKNFQDPQMQMNDYNLNRLFAILQTECGVHKTYAEFSNHDGALGVILYFRKNIKT